MRKFQCITALLLVVQAFAQKSTTVGPSNGSLIILGSGYDSTVMNKFIQLAGGPKSKWVFIPTALDDSTLKPYLSKLPTFRLVKAMPNVKVLHTRDRKVADLDTFAHHIQTANAVFLEGGRQWRLADAYLHTKVHRELNKLLERGGVIMGGSAGATIQGSYLIRGDTKNNFIIMGDHEEGFGFISNIAIDQHLLARNRAFDMFELLDKRPELLGIGLDEGAAILVQKNIFEVLTDKYVAVYDGKKLSQGTNATIGYKEAGKHEFYFLKKGDFYDLKNRTKTYGNPVEIDPSLLQVYAGRYRQKDDSTEYTLVAEGNVLVLNDGRKREEKYVLYPKSASHFFSKKGPETIEFKLTPPGIQHTVRFPDGTTHTFDKIP